MSRRMRLDADLVRRQLANSRQEALDFILAGRVLVNGAPADKPSRQVDPADNVLVSGEPSRFVGRGGEKLQAALEHFDLSVQGLTVLDAGASTGGFTDCLLQNGARHVLALDVGHGQLHPRIRADDRVTVIERMNIRHFDRPEFVANSGRNEELQLSDAAEGGFDLVVADLSFISLTVVAPVLVAASRVGGNMVVLIKPQFEAGRQEVSRAKGVITDPKVHEQACEQVTQAFKAAGAEIQGIMVSPIVGGQGNKEFLLHAVVRERLSS